MVTSKPVTNPRNATPLEHTVDALVTLATSAGVEELDDHALRRRVNAIVDLYLVGFGVWTASERTRLARAFKDRLVRPTQTGGRILAMITR